MPCPKASPKDDIIFCFVERNVEVHLDTLAQGCQFCEVLEMLTLWNCAEFFEMKWVMPLTSIIDTAGIYVNVYLGY